MSVHSDKIDNHVVYTNLENVLNEIESIKEKSITPEATEVLARLTLVAKNFSTAIENCNKELIAVSWLDDASKALINLKSYLATFISNKDVNSLRNNSNSQIDVLLHSSVKLNCVKSSQSLKGITNAQNEYIEFVNAQNQLLANRVKELEDAVKTFEDEIQENEDVSKKKLQELSSAIETERTRLDGFATTYQQQMQIDKNAFSEMSDTLKKSFQEAQEEREENFAENVKEFDERATDIITNYQKRFNEYEQQVVNIVGVVNTNMFSHKYKEVADDAKDRAKTWHRIAMGLMIAVSAFAVYAFVITINADTSWIKLVAKIFATTTLVTGAAYAARQASKQEKVERYARKIEMELVAIDPFIQSLEKETQSMIKEEIAKKIFGNADTMEISLKEEPYKAMDKLTSIEDMLQTVVGLLDKLPK